MISSKFFFKGFKSIDPTQKAKPLIGSSVKSFNIFSEIIILSNDVSKDIGELINV